MSTLSISREFNSFWNYAAHGCNNAVLFVRQMGRLRDDTGLSQQFLGREKEISDYICHTPRKSGKFDSRRNYSLEKTK